ncbi:hypothetical protein CHUAL_005587 [Chamberlinius hualienensis]
MKRQDRDSPTKSSKRTCTSASRMEDCSRDHASPERERGADSPSHGSTGKPSSASSTSRHGKSRGTGSGGTGSAGGSPERNISSRGNPNHESRTDEYSHGSTRSYEKDYRIICVSGFSHRVSDATIRDSVYREFKKFGDPDVKLAEDNGERLVYVYFRSPEDARDARHAKSKLVLFDKPVLVEPVLESSSSNNNHDRRPRGRSSLSPDSIGAYTGKSSRNRGGSPTHSTSSLGSLHRRGRRGGSPGDLRNPVGHHDGGYRRDSLPPPLPHHHPDYLPPPIPGGQPSPRPREEKKEKFPNYLHHIPPEEDDKANRTLFVGNLEVNITEAELRRIFERYGVVEDIDIKRPPPGQGNAYAFIKFLNLDMAHKAKVEMSGQYVGKFQCKIGYGKAIPTTRIWVGGLGPWTSLSHLEREFDRFGAIKKIDFVKGDNHSYILYDSIDAAQAACKEMRGFPLGGPNKRLRVDFADAGPYNYHQSSSGSGRPVSHATYNPDDDPYYRPRHVDHDIGIRGGAPDPYYYSSSRDPEYSRWPGSSGAYAPSYDPYYERGSRGRIHDDWPHYDRERHHDDYDWPHDYPSWRDGGHPRDWPVSDSRRKRPRSPVDMRYERELHSRGGADLPESSYRRYARQRTPPDGPMETSPLTRRRRSPLPPKAYRSVESGRERDLTPPGRPSLRGEHQRSRSHDKSGGVGGGGEHGERERSTRGSGQVRDESKHENGRNREAFPPLPNDVINSLPPGQAERLLSATTLTEVTKVLPCTWQGGLILKNSYFPVKLMAFEGDVQLVEAITKNGSGENQVFRITQRLRLDQPKLDDITKRLAANGSCILLGMAAAIDEQNQLVIEGASVQQRTLRHLVSYLKQKEAAGVISLSGVKEVQGVLYAFPPCRFSHEPIRRLCPAVTEEGLKEDHLVVIAVKGGI